MKVDTLGKRNSPKQKQESKDKIDLLIDIQEKIKAGKGAGYEHWAKIFNLKQAAKVAFSALNTEKLPTIKELSKEYEKLLAEKKNLYSDYRKKKKEMQEILTVKSNVDRLLFPPQKEQPERENER